MHNVLSKRRHFSRGAALVETALVLTFLLGLMVAGFQIGMISYTQINLDQAAQVNARIAALGYGDSASVSFVQQHLPQIQNSVISPVVAENPVAINSANAVNFNGSTGRIGGYSFTLPLPAISLAQTGQYPLYLGSTKINLSGFGLESKVAEVCPHVCANSSGLTANNSTNYYTAGENTAPYFMSFNFMRSCLSNPAWDLSQPPLGLTYYNWGACTNLTSTNIANTTIDLRALGTAAHLDQYNDFYRLQGTTLASNYNTYLQAPDASQAGPFYETWCHRNKFIWLEANVFSLYPNYSDLTPSGVNDNNQNEVAGSGFKEPQHFLSLWFGIDGATNFPKVGSQMYNSYLTHLNAGWDVTAIAGGTHYVASPTNYLTPWYGCQV